MEIPLFKIFWEEEDINLIEQVIRSGNYWCVGSEIEEFENKIAEYLGAKHCVALNSGGSALQALMDAYGVGHGDEVIVPSFTFIATAYAPMYVGARPVFADVEEQTFGLDPEDVKSRISAKTKAIIPIHYGGMPCKIDALKKLAKDNDLVLIEDAAESFGARLKNKSAGTFGDSAVFSFCHNKIFTTSEGGCIITDDDAINEKVRLYRSYGRVVNGDYFSGGVDVDYIEVGYNLRLSTLLAALGISQLSRVDKAIARRKKNAQRLNKGMRNVTDVIVPLPPSDDYDAVYQMYTIRVKEGRQKRDELMRYLMKMGIASKVYFDPVHKYSVFRNLGYTEVNLPTTELLASQVLTLPMYPNMTDDEIDYIANTLIDFF
jgi:perosamine synthetase